jgi:hypothetical protein
MAGAVVTIIATALLPNPVRAAVDRELTEAAEEPVAPTGRFTREPARSRSTVR